MSDRADPSVELTDPIPAATVVLLRDRADGIETLMLHRDAKLAFAGGAWVFPGGRVDPEDYPPGAAPDTADDEVRLTAARRAAAREAMEEAGLAVDPLRLVWFAHWTPAMSTPRRFATWFFAAEAPAGAVVIDDGEIRAHEWVAPREVLRRHGAGDIELLPPTWMTLTLLDTDSSVDGALRRMGEHAPTVYETRIGRRDQSVAAMWEGDAGYESGDIDRPGPRHRLWLDASGWRFERSD